MSKDAKHDSAKARGKNDQETIDVVAELTSSDLRRARFYDLLLRRKWFGIYVVIFFLLSLAFIIVDATGYYNIPIAGLLIAIFFLFVLVGGFIYLCAISTGGKRRSLHFSPRCLITPANQDDRMLTFDWGKFLDIRETKNYIYLYLDVTQFIIVPKRCFDQQQLRTVKAWALASGRPYHIKNN